MTDHDPIEQFRDAIRRELASDDDPDSVGWVVVYECDDGRYVFDFTFAWEKSAAWDAILAYVYRYRGEDWTARFPWDGNRKRQLGWLRAAGYRLRWAEIRVIEPGPPPGA